MSLELKKTAPVIDLQAMRSPEGYLVEDEDLIAAANTAIALGKPLLLTGEPGIGKSDLAGWIAAQTPACALHKFVVKSTTEAAELFYRFDTLARFRDTQIESAHGNPNTETPTALAKKSALLRYIQYNALGTAILHSIGSEQAELLGFISPALGDKIYQSFPKAFSTSVVLIDEIDKAPRDVPNDILDEIDHLSFRVPELGNIEVSANPKQRPLVIITSNSERDLPKPFLRRCIYYHMRLSDDQGVLQRIAEQRIGKRYEGNGTLLGEALQLFRDLRREASLRYQPGLAELLDWLADLSLGNPPANSSLADLPHAKSSLKNALLKDPEDQKLADSEWDNWVSKAQSAESSG